MKTYLTAGLLLLSSHFFSQKPEKVYRLVREERDFTFYDQQASLWKKITEKDPKNAAAWENYYYATRYSNMTDPSGPTEIRKKQMHAIVNAMEKNVRGTIEYYHCKLINFDKGTLPPPPEQLSLIEKALALNPNDPDILEEAIINNEIMGTMDKQKEYFVHMQASGIYELPILEANYNMMMSADKNAILFTMGDNETFPAWMLQQARGIRTDVTIINLSLAGSLPDYLKRLLKQKNISLPGSFYEKLKLRDQNIFIRELVAEINKANPSVPLFFAITAGVSDILTDSLYCTGLAYQYSPTRVENMSKLKDNIENKFHLDYLNNGLVEVKQSSKQLCENFNYNYFVPFGMLYKYYKNLNESNPKMQFYKDFCLGNAAKRGKQEQMKEYLDGK